jgi:hypothetical protein
MSFFVTDSFHYLTHGTPPLLPCNSGNIVVGIQYSSKRRDISDV